MKPSKIEPLPEPYQSLFEAVLWNCGPEAISEFVRNGADLRYQHPYTGQTALRLATISNRVKTVEALLQHGADPNQKFTYRSPADFRKDSDRVALHHAISAEVVAALIKAGADVNAADAAGTTPLMCAAFRGPPVVVRALLASGASPLLRQRKRRGKRAHTALELAKSKVEFWRDALNDPDSVNDSNRETVNGRLKCYEEICDILVEAERAAPAAESSAGSSGKRTRKS